ncbi:hypothetical protein ACRALDRAFT_1058468 [Sodiomyces alcalophilus JCM 7366]|uniref:uncharacterized protein n=1 Tax=Sodiomyces alcalophilus JCM 7366 TaxID=591952 RepID=UPI0039B3F404
MAPPKSRVRKFHRRSKNGCSSCKRRHVRCDERKPLCTYCLQSGSQCIYPGAPEVTGKHDSHIAQPSLTSCKADGLVPLVTTYHPFSSLDCDFKPSSKSKWLLHQSFTHPGLLHGSLVVAACQWAWVTGSLEYVKVPFLHHKAAAYQFARQQINDPETAFTDTTVFAIAALALVEGAMGDLNASSKHLRGLHQLTMRKNGYRLCEVNLAQQMLEMAGDRLRQGEISAFYDATGADFQPTVIALIFTSLWDMSSLPPREAPKYGWWEANETENDRLWQSYTKNLNWELSRNFDPEHNLTKMLNSDPKSSRASYIATFLYLLMALNSSEIDGVLTIWLMEQLIDDIDAKEEDVRAGTFSRHLWFWSVLFGAAVAAGGQPRTVNEQHQLAKWRSVYAGKLRLASQLLGLCRWSEAKKALAEVAWKDGMPGEARLRAIWEDSLIGDHVVEDTKIRQILDLTDMEDVSGQL